MALTDKLPIDTHFLVVEDLAAMRKIICDMLRHCGYVHIHEAADGVEALEVLGREKIGFVVSGRSMPRMSGIALLRKVRSDPALQDLPFIMITSEAHAPKVVEALHAGVSDYLIKPFSAKIFQERLEWICENLKKTP